METGYGGLCHAGQILQPITSDRYIHVSVAAIEHSQDWLENQTPDWRSIWPG